MEINKIKKIYTNTAKVRLEYATEGYICCKSSRKINMHKRNCVIYTMRTKCYFRAIIDSFIKKRFIRK